MNKQLVRSLIKESYEYTSVTDAYQLEEGSEVQSIIFDKNSFTQSQARDWLKSHGFVNSGVDEKENTLRYRQKEPSLFKRFITKQIKDGIQFIIGFK